MTTQEILDIIILIEIVIAVIIITAFIFKSKKSKHKIKEQLFYSYQAQQKQYYYDNLINTTYSKKQYFLSPIEQKVFKNIQIAIDNSKLIVYPQINLATIVERTDGYKYHNELFRNLDFCLFNKDTFEPICAIELNDRTHLQEDRQERDAKVLAILNSARIPLLTLYTSNNNTPESIRQQIIKLNN